MLASADYLESQLRNDEREVLSVLAEAKRLDADENEVPFVEMALVNIRERVNALKSAGWNTNEMVLKNEIIARAEAEAVDREARAANRRAVGEPCQQPAEGEAGRSAGMETARSMQPVEQPQQVREGMGRGNRQARRKDGRTDSYYFFQARDGQHLYLHPLDIRVLKQEYGDYDEFPETITVRVVGVEESTLTEELRKRCRYLSHLPLSCDVTFVEVDWQGLVGEETMKMFTGERRWLHARWSVGVSLTSETDGTYRGAGEFRERKERQAAKRARDTGVASQNLRRGQVRVPSPLPSTSSTSQLSQPVEDDPFFATLNSSAGKEDPVAAGRHGPSGSFAAVASGRGQSSGTRGAWGAAAVDQHESDDHPSNVWWGDYDDDEIAAAGKGKKKFVLMSSGGARRGKYR
ncbi:MAG: hypothetical protein BJ554DRAFT_6871 [Olpidium bornovanus]|uniref:Uncharacterized protein n=1 Tax=Olpidium bornovanus TaxID=278681 RepID=A0A8H7ZX04_9FUNG|nr:MAG: hypothetical protein BJ554DRAFT_6871 [Olpidium bornovanus]